MVECSHPKYALLLDDIHCSDIALCSLPPTPKQPPKNIGLKYNHCCSSSSSATDHVAQFDVMASQCMDNICFATKINPILIILQLSFPSELTSNYSTYYFGLVLADRCGSFLSLLLSDEGPTAISKGCSRMRWVPLHNYTSVIGNSQVIKYEGCQGL